MKTSSLGKDRNGSAKQIAATANDVTNRGQKSAVDFSNFTKTPSCRLIVVAGRESGQVTTRICQEAGVLSVIG